MRKYFLAFCLCSLLGLSACEKAADVFSPLNFAKNGVSFFYPGNWEVAEEGQQEDVHYIFIESPGSAIGIIQVYIKDEAVTLDEFAPWLSEESKAEIPVGEFGESTFTEVEKQTASKQFAGITERFSISLLGQKVPHRREFFTVESPDRKAFVVTQAPTEDLSLADPGFDLILETFELKE